MTTPIDDPVERRLVPTDPLEVHGMRAGVNDHDHGAFRAAASVAPADLTASTLLPVPDGDRAVCDVPWPEAVDDLVFRTVVIASGAELDLRLDLLVPDGPGPFPLVVFVPGGGFVMSPKHAALLRRTVVAQRGFAVASIEYRTLRTGVYADGVDDVAAAVAFLRRHAQEFRVDARRVALWGESAGGYLAALAVTTRAVTDISCVVDVFGLTDLAQVAMDFDAAEQARHHTPEITEAQYVFGRHSGMTIDDDPDEVQRANPVRHVRGGEPPFLLFHGEVDGLVSPGQSQLLHRALLAHGVDSTRYVVAGAGHYGPEWSSATVLDLVAGFLAARLADTDPHDMPITFRSGPSDPIRLADEPGTWVEIEVAAPPERVWELVTDIDLPARFSPEFLGATWVGDGPAVGATFMGRNRHPRIGEWEVPSFVEVCDGRRFGWATVDAADPGSRWWFDVEPTAAGTRLRYSLSLGPGRSGLTAAIASMPDREPAILRRRLREHHGNMVRTVEGIAAVAEGRDPRDLESREA